MHQWSIPGGLLELGETLREAVVREFAEETGIAIRAGELLGVFDRVVRDPSGGVQYHYVLIDFLCEVIGGANYQQVEMRRKRAGSASKS